MPKEQQYKNLLTAIGLFIISGAASYMSSHVEGGFALWLCVVSLFTFVGSFIGLISWAEQ